MKNTYIKKIFGTTLMTLLLLACTDILEEQPREFYEPGYFRSEKGVDGALTSMYAHLRYIYGNAYYFNNMETGTDEATYAQSADGNFKDADLSQVGLLDATSCRADVLWYNSFYNINTANGVIEIATEVDGISDALIAEARFFRAFDYFSLVKTFGGVPLDLGAGELAFNTSTSRVSVRNTVPEVYTLAVFPDLLIAINELPDAGRVTGGVTKTLARLVLAKAYLTYAWWLENPNGIPTYPTTNRTDPDGHDSQWYFQAAYDIATAGIDNPGSFSLQPTFYDVHVGSNDRHSEMLLYADHTEASELYNGASLGYSGAGDADNAAVWMMTWNYTNLKSSTDPAWPGDTEVSSVQREASQAYGRPWTRMAPTINVIESTFADKTNDSRYDGTFVTDYRGNWPKGGVTEDVLYGANGMALQPGDAVLTFLDAEPATPIDYSNTAYNSGVGAGVLPGRADFVISPRGISRNNYPGLWKIGTYRTDNGTGLGSPNGAVTRPFPIAKFSELYFVAAEAAVKGAATTGGKTARELINVIRARAGMWRWDNNEGVEKIVDNSLAMTAATPATITVDYILQELSREYYGEAHRWFDLARTQKWHEVAATYEIAGSEVGNHTAEPVNRTIEAYHYLRPIPQGQLDNLDMSEAEKDEYQNPGY